MTDSPETPNPATPEDAENAAQPASATPAGTPDIEGETTLTPDAHGTFVAGPDAVSAPPASDAPAAPVPPVTPPAAAAPPAPPAPPAAPIARRPAPIYNGGQPIPAATPTPAPQPTTPYPAPVAGAAQAGPAIGQPAVASAPHIAGAPHNAGAPHVAGAQPAAQGDSFKRRTPVALIAVGLAAALIGGVSGAGVTYWAVNNNQTSQTTANAQPANITVNDADDATIVTAVAAKASPSVVTISTVGSNGSGTGSGVILDKKGYILTNTHVVTLDGAAANAKVSVQTSDGRLLAATIVGTDPISDLAVIKVEADDSLQPVEFADSSNLNVGDTAIAIGAPLGLTTTVTNGIVSALNRSITVASSAVPEDQQSSEDTEGDSGDSPFDFWQFDTPGDEQAPTASTSTISLAVIQTDAAINPGNSGGALLDAEGKLIGINVAIASAGDSSSASGNIGVGFSIPSNLAKRVSEEIIANGSATHGLLGASILDVTEDTAVSNSSVVGASVKEVSSGGAAASAGLKVGDVITGINGLPVTGKNDLTAQVRALAGGAEATITYVRNGKTATTDVTLGKL
ncbi:PDZ domain-containing protein [Glaciihabitans arcticus]|uniref:PDZ domain-containing protein n=1 Tax=Glaciihabitans arcticus TaxID=2668039 RepID=A0A4Q9GRV7_9MICO|nr:trypsin-like peptidase domain-containing protein [Glaciihabitans arcticus]TBN57295.1 PDZ domain-containing protein [Glaciihabitans arcticus]